MVFMPVNIWMGQWVWVCVCVFTNSCATTKPNFTTPGTFFLSYLDNTTGTTGGCYCDKGTRTRRGLTTGTVCVIWFAGLWLGDEVGSMRMNWSHGNTRHGWWRKWWVTSLDYFLASCNLRSISHLCLITIWTWKHFKLVNV
jgi:hypothetical protein